MKYALLIPLMATVFAGSSFSQERIYRCGNEYTNKVPTAQTRGCKLMEGGNVTVVQGTQVALSAAPGARVGAAASATPSSGPRVATGEQKMRDSDARKILDHELKMVQDRHAELLKEFKSGAPDKRGEEMQNQQKYLERVNQLKASLARNEGDMAGIRRELDRLGPATAAK